MKIKKTFPKILGLIISTSFLFIILFITLFYYTLKVEKEVYNNSTKQFNNEINKLIELDSKPIAVGINNDTNWDEFVNFINTKDTNWYNQTIGNELEIYGADYLGAYDADKNFIIRSPTSTIKSIDFIPKQTMDLLFKVGIHKSYLKIPEGIVEVTGAAIHTSDDPLKNKTPTSGYFFVVRLLNKEFIKKLEQTTDSSIEFINVNDDYPIEKHKIVSIIDLKDSQNKTLSRLVFKRNFDVYFENITNLLYIIILAFFIGLVINLIYTRSLVYYPLDLIKRVLETGNSKAIKLLKKTNGEFSHIGNLFEENRNQKLELINAKLKAEEGDRLKSSFLANLSHEIRTPMNAINGFTDLLINTNLSEEEKLEYLKVIDKSGRNLVSIIDDLIEMSKIDSNQIKPNYSNINLESCINELYTAIKITIPKSKNLDFYIIKNDNPAIYNIVTDEIKLKQIIINLITNAIKFTDEGHIAFGYSIDDENKKIIFTIKDTGLGIDKDNHKHIFDRFKQVDNDASIKAGGLGLGLAISKAYVDMMGGMITLESTVNEGSVFSFSIPLQYDELNTITVQSINNVEVSKGEEEGTILIAEDDNINFLLFQKIMQVKNYKVIRAVNGLEAVDICINNPNIDVVLMDIKMPIMNGFEALEKVKSIRPNLVVIAQTAYSSSEDEERIYKAGFYGYITKPINREKLFEVLNQVLHGQKPE